MGSSGPPIRLLATLVPALSSTARTATNERPFLARLTNVFRRFVDRFMVMFWGKIAEQEPTEEVLSRDPSLLHPAPGRRRQTPRHPQRLAARRRPLGPTLCRRASRIDSRRHLSSTLFAMVSLNLRCRVLDLQSNLRYTLGWRVMAFTFDPPTCGPSLHSEVVESPAGE
jgi:hypothetical protein